jgi:hypothetical protein
MSARRDERAETKMPASACPNGPDGASTPGIRFADDDQANEKRALVSDWRGRRPTFFNAGHQIGRLA